MNMNSFYIPKTAVEYIKNDFKDKFEIIDLEFSNDTVKIEFNRKINELDLTNLFFAGAKWGLNHIYKTN